jgi:hypothetical protein
MGIFNQKRLGAYLLALVMNHILPVTHAAPLSPSVTCATAVVDISMHADWVLPQVPSLSLFHCQAFL